MRVERVAGLTALTSGALLVLALIASALIAPAVGDANAGSFWSMGPSMMGAGHMGSGMSGMGHGMSHGSSGTAATAIPGAIDVRVQATNFSFTPSEIRLPKDGVNLTLTNPASTRATHDLTVPALGIHLAADPGETRIVGLRGLPAGRYDAYCSVPGHADLGMRATVVVE